MEMIEVKTAELSGAALDWAVGVAEGNPMEAPASDVVWSKYHGAYSPSTDWSQGGTLMDKHIVRLDTIRDCRPDRFIATTNGWPMGEQRGETILIASCRAIVAAKLGETVSVPRELLP